MITVVISCGSSSFGLVGTLSSLVSGASEGIVRDVILVGDSKNDELLDIADLTGADLIAHTGTRAACLKAGGMAPVRGDWLLFLEPGVRLEPGWYHDAAEFIQSASKNGRSDHVATFRYRSETSAVKDRLLQFAYALRTRTAGMPARDQGLLINRQFYRHLGGHRDYGGLTDAALWHRLGGRRVSRLSAGILPVHSDAPARTRPRRHSLRMALVCMKFPPALVARMI